MQKYEVKGVKIGSFNFQGIDYNHEYISDAQAEKLLEAGYPYLRKKEEISSSSIGPQLVQIPAEKQAKK